MAYSTREELLRDAKRILETNPKFVPVTEENESPSNWIDNGEEPPSEVARGNYENSSEEEFDKENWSVLKFSDRVEVYPSNDDHEIVAIYKDGRELVWGWDFVPAE